MQLNIGELVVHKEVTEWVKSGHDVGVEWRLSHYTRQLVNYAHAF